jgi:hypothetical protein
MEPDGRWAPVACGYLGQPFKISRNRIVTPESLRKGGRIDRKELVILLGSCRPQQFLGDV